MRLSVRRLLRPRLPSLTIGAKIFVLSAGWLFALAVVSGAAWYGVDAISRAQAVADRANTLGALVERTRRVAATLSAAERNYLRLPSPQAADGIRALVAETTDVVGALNEAARDLGLDSGAPVQLRAAIQTLRADVGRLETVQKRIGYGADQGVVGALTAAADALRSDLNRISKSGQNPETVRVVQAFAQMGQAKAEYMLAADDVSKGAFDAAVGRYQRQVGTAKIDDAAKAKLGELVATYADAFNGYVDARAARERAADKVSLGLDNLGPMAASIEQAAAQRHDDAARDLETAKTTVVAAVAATLAVMLAIGVVCSLVIGRGVTRPLGRLRAGMTALSRGEDVEIEGTLRGDEIGAMARAVQVFRENALERGRLEAEAEVARGARAERQERVEAAVRAFRTEVETLMRSVADTAATMRSTAGTLTASAETSAAQADEASRASTAASSKVAVVAAAAEELSASIHEIAARVAGTTAVVATADADTRRTNQRVASLAEAASRVGEIVTLIETIASQTNLLALNATIEAARAGEAGRGFAVVAHEVKNLAGQTARATEQIAAQVAAIQASTREAVGAIGGIAEVMADVNRTTVAIAAAVEEQGAATAEISRTVVDASADTRVVSDGVAVVTAAIDGTRAAAAHVEGAAAVVVDRAAALERAIDGFLEAVAA
ncbi:methyl-accepting chemotaxis protein [Oharaeibacter diazotrophicus]|uniref:Methyl-accepting chemotaxis protein n=1 Tax=Oharaeibacter diazotrophicus TaxID=1920512 RepID=A0A4R6RDI3_9HYPH|nr:methyl-accepting chemotaxis protein [Oharaeibacter diazotrophicus]TDP84125.1 methyl-accepting chemotaxis protein [Oharaeibacter diazotrophicus]BBE73164.1 methyl-accepting chemotaxis protein 3 [Pleomorphomonas sp. SM30]GLS74953.1 methyl-accepting chemotaxis protein [Oharaeibacter diazotrophicus]